MNNNNNQKSLFADTESMAELIMKNTISPELWRLLMVFKNTTNEEDKSQAVIYFTQYGLIMSEKNSPEKLDEILNFTRKFRELRGSVRQHMERNIFDVLSRFIFTSYTILTPLYEPGLIPIDRKKNRDKNERIDNAFHILVKIVDFIDETIKYQPSGLDVLDGGRKAMAVKTIETLLDTIKYPKLYDILIRVLLSNYKAAVLTTLDLIYYNGLKNKKMKKALRILAVSSKDKSIKDRAEGLLDLFDK
ncbi:MAG: hypothetical protein KAT34_08595 [Candidatus Aminicenantes bacterium]|nr:hypothetical protein [Candidatus Aminicenantes bacterium]